MSRLVHTYCLLLAAEATITIVDCALRVFCAIGVLAPLRSLVTSLTLIAALATWCALALIPALQKTTVIAATAFPFIVLGLVTPFHPQLVQDLSLPQLLVWDPVVVARTAPTLMTLTVVVALLQLLLAYQLLQLLGGSLRRPCPLPGRMFSRRRAIMVLLVHGLVFVFLLPPYLLFCLSRVIHAGSHGFVQADVDKLSLVERHYRRNDKIVVLVGMMHIGKPGFYRQLLDRLRSTPSKRTIFLTEGVRDPTKRLQQRTQYEGLATALGLEAQAHHFKPERHRAVATRWADLDTRSFDLRTIAFIEAASRIHEGDLGGVLQFHRLMRDKAAVIAIYRDIVTRRNEKLIATIDLVLPGYDRIVVPWGAYHMGEVEDALLTKGFQTDHTELHPIVHYRDVFRASKIRRPGNNGNSP